MNTQHFTYALEVEKTGSITQAAENLFMTQPTLSKAIKDLEMNLGFTIFKRSPKGVVPTQKGKEFLVHAKKILTQIERMSLALHAHDTDHQLFSLAIPRVSYIAQAASEFACSFDNNKNMELDILEGSSMRVIDAVAHGHFVLGIIRLHQEDEDYFLRCLSEKDVQYEPVWESDYVALMRQDHPLADREHLTARDFADYIQMEFGDEEVPYIRVSETEIPKRAVNSKRILVYDRAMQFDILRTNPLAYMMVSPMPEEQLRQNGLVQRRFQNHGHFKDLLISRKGYHLSKLDREFLDKLYLQKNKVAYGV